MSLTTIFVQFTDDLKSKGYFPPNALIKLMENEHLIKLFCILRRKNINHSVEDNLEEPKDDESSKNVKLDSNSLLDDEWRLLLTYLDRVCFLLYVMILIIYHIG